jgi:hypothetical protein
MILRIASKIRHALQSSSRQQGQSLVELAIITPLLLLLFLGLAEVGAALHSYLIVTEATREGARYGARGMYVTDTTVSHKTRNSGQELDITLELPGDTFVLDEEKATIIVSRLRKIFSGGSYRYEVLSQYSEGDQPSILTPEWLATKENEVSDSGFADNVLEMNMIAVEMTYDHPQLTGLFAFLPFLSDPIPMRAITIMRLGKSRDIPECCAYPIAIHEDTLAGKSKGQSLGDIYNGSGDGNFGWLRWPKETSAGNEGYLVDSLKDPCLSRGDFDNATNPSDHQLSVEDDVWGNTGLSDSSDVRTALDNLKGQKILVLVWDTASGTGTNGYYHIVAFAWVRITDYRLPGQDRITAIFEGLATECNEVYSGTY